MLGTQDRGRGRGRKGGRKEGREEGKGGIKEVVYNINRAQHGNVIIPLDALCPDRAQCVPGHIDQGNAAIGEHNQ